VSSRSKEEDLDYRYFLEGDIPWITIDSSILEKLKSEMPESINSKKERYISKYDIPEQVADVLSSDKFYSDLFEESHSDSNAKEIANIITTDLMGLIDTREKRESSKMSSTHLRDLADAIISGKISRNSSKNALYEIVKTGNNISQIISDLDLGNVSDESELTGIIQEIIISEPQAVEQAKSNPQTINYLVGKVMQKTKGKADPTLTLDLLKKLIE
jgi:aspartyl-tRNA(Asn)/glutamyl-tRNA(Gln) amidotransferase subunit B